MLHVRKVIEHVYEKVLGNDNSGNSNNHADKEQTGPPTEEELAELGALAEARVELLCHDQVGVNYHVTYSPFFVTEFYSLHCRRNQTPGSNVCEAAPNAFFFVLPEFEHVL